jgi:hypothetical protein
LRPRLQHSLTQEKRAMAKSHKKAGVGLDVTTSLTPEQLLDLAKESLAGVRGGLAKEMSSRIEGDYPMSLDVSVLEGDQRRVTTRITDDKVTQSTYSPISPKRMMG